MITQRWMPLIALAFVGAMANQACAEYVAAKNGLNIRSKPEADAEIVGVLPFAEEVDGGREGSWLKIDNGYVKAAYLSDSDPIEDFEPLGTYSVTAYYETGFPTASGTYPAVGTTLAHNSLPFGTEVYIDGLGFWTVEDRGPTSMGTQWCDIYLGDYDTCVQFGNQYKEVYLVDSEE